MRLPKRDAIATALVIVAAALYVLWAAGPAVPGLGSARVTGAVILALGFAASASAVVPGFDDLLHGNRVYLVGTSLIGLLAFGAGLVMLVTASEIALGVMMGTMAVLWCIATMHHTQLAGGMTRARHRPYGRMHGPHAAGVA